LRRFAAGLARAATVALLLGTLATAAPAGAATTASTQTFSFETGFEGWQPDHYVHPEFGPLEWSITRSTAEVFDGTWALNGFVKSPHDDGTIWVERPFFIGTGKTAKVDLTFQLWGPCDCSVGAHQVVATASARNPEIEEDFTIIGTTSKAKWNEYAFSGKATAGNNGVIWVAFGINAVQTDFNGRNHPLDFARVTLS
jgi:hypothetical protein